MRAIDFVMDTNVFYAGLRSQRGTSHLLLREIGRNRALKIHLSVPLVLEYEEVAKRHSKSLGLTYAEIDDILDYLCSVAGLHSIFYLWRPYLPDPNDDMLLEVAVEAKCSCIVTFNQRHFPGIEKFGIQPVNPYEILSEIGVLP